MSQDTIFVASATSATPEASNSMAAKRYSDTECEAAYVDQLYADLIADVWAPGHCQRHISRDDLKQMLNYTWRASGPNTNMAQDPDFNRNFEEGSGLHAHPSPTTIPTTTTATTRRVLPIRQRAPETWGRGRAVQPPAQEPPKQRKRLTIRPPTPPTPPSSESESEGEETREPRIIWRFSNGGRSFEWWEEER
ncbi:hypothetical protein MMC10_000178 [Thelotrema lepadinum]|nr:hypothetical protein [Thelotrema lepadinum]